MRASQPDLMALAHGIQHCRSCPLHRHRRHAVPGEGPATARVMLVGEAPGELEDEQGRPFVGRSGRFLTEVLAEHGFDRRDLFITSSVKCRPPDNRTPHLSELATCGQRWLEQQIAAVAPCVIVLLGQTPVRQVLHRTEKLGDRHGEVHEAGGQRYLITYHPAAGMRFPRVAAAMRQDLRRLRALLA